MQRVASECCRLSHVVVVVVVVVSLLTVSHVTLNGSAETLLLSFIAPCCADAFIAFFCQLVNTPGRCSVQYKFIQFN